MDNSTRFVELNGDRLRLIRNDWKTCIDEIAFQITISKSEMTKNQINDIIFLDFTFSWKLQNYFTNHFLITILLFDISQYIIQNGSLYVHVISIYLFITCYIHYILCIFRIYVSSDFYHFYFINIISVHRSFNVNRY